MVFNWGWICPPPPLSEHIWRCWWQFWLSHMGGGWRECVTGIYWVEASDAAKHTTMSKAAPQQQRIIWPQMSVVPKLRNGTLIRMANVKLQGFIYNTSFSKKYFLMSTEWAYKNSKYTSAGSPWPTLSLSFPTKKNYDHLRMVNSLLISRYVQDKARISRHIREKTIKISWGHFKRIQRPISYGFYRQISRQFWYHLNNSINLKHIAYV